MIMLGGIHREYFNILDLKLYRHALFAEHTSRTIQNKTGMCRVRAVNTFTIGACFSQTFFFRECVCQPTRSRGSFIPTEPRE